MEVVLGYVLGVASVLLILLVVRARRTASPPELSAVVQGGRESKRDRRIAELAEVVTELGEEIAQLTFDPAAPEVRPESLTDYRRALDSYGNARDALNGRDLERVRQELTYARNALVRLDARAHGLPVPIDVSRAARDRGEASPHPFQMERFSYSGSNEQTYLIPIDWPEPGRAAIMEVARNGTGFTQFGSALVPAEEANPKTVDSHLLGAAGALASTSPQSRTVTTLPRTCGSLRTTCDPAPGHGRSVCVRSARQWNCCASTREPARRCSSIGRTRRPFLASTSTPRVRGRSSTAVSRSTAAASGANSADLKP